MQYDISTSDFPVLSLRMAELGGGYDAPGESQEETPDLQQQWIEVLVDSPAANPAEDDQQKLFTYRVPSGMDVQPGDILSVPFGSQLLGAIAIRFTDRLPAGLAPERVREVEDAIVSGLFAPEYWQMLQRVADYYYTPLVRAIRSAMPPGLFARSQHRIRLTGSIPPGGTEFVRSIAARKILELLQESPNGNYTWQYLRNKVKKGAASGLRDLKKRGWVESYYEAIEPPAPKLQQAVTLVTSSLPRDLTKRQGEVLQVLRRRGGELWMTELLQICNTSSSVVKKLAEKGYVEIYDREELRSPSLPAQGSDRPKVLTSYQQNAVNAIDNLDGYARVLLHGVTGSGKTEVYLQAIAPILERGESAIVLVPEIGLTPQLCDRFRARYGDKVVVYHSRLSDGERYDTWRQTLTGTPQIAIGTRSAIFLPLPKVGIIILDEEYDDSYKQDQPAPTYHARKVAQWRAELSNCPLILGSATPSLETWVEIAENRATETSDSTSSFTPEDAINSDAINSDAINSDAINSDAINSDAINSDAINSDAIYRVSTGNSVSPTHYLNLPERIEGRSMPPVEVVDMRQELRKGNRSIFSEALQQQLHNLRETGKQGILFIHRRGHSTFISCRSCGYVMECPHCDVSLSYHQVHEGGADFLRCHYCGYMQRPPTRCPECDSPYFRHFGSGTQRVMQELQREFPQLRPLRFDSDTTRTKGAHRTLLSQFANGEKDILIGTQMLTKGLDLPQVTVVGVVAADGLLNLSDFRASERAFQMLTQVVGRAGRGDDPGRAIVQTYAPEHPVIQAVQRQEYESFVQSELEQREALNYPPYGRLILLRISGRDDWTVEDTAIELAQVLGGQNASLTREYELLGPAPAPILRVADRYRWQILLKFPAEVPVELPSLEELRSRCPREISLAIDVDPLNMS